MKGIIPHSFLSQEKPQVLLCLLLAFKSHPGRREAEGLGPESRGGGAEA
jgi:hypothetical protein